MSKMEKLYLRLSKESIYNSRLWLDEANHLLFERQSYGHAMSLLLFSIEESVKSWICFSVGIGVVNHNHKLVKEVFKSHPSKMELVMVAWITLTQPLILKSHLYKLNEEEQRQIKELFTKIDPVYSSVSDRLVKLRSKGMYVDVLKGKISTPNEISKLDVEAIFIDVYNFCKSMEMMIDDYENLDDETRQEKLRAVKKDIQIATENWRNIIGKQ